MNHFVVLKSSFLALMLTTASSVYSNELSLEQALDYALDNEPWLTANKYQQAAVQAQSLAAGTLPDPVLTLGLMNLLTDSFAFDQEGMTQLKVGVSQMFSRGDSLELKQQALAQSAQQYSWLRADRLVQVKTIVIESWLNAYRAQQSIALIEQDKALFTQLIDITESSYASSVGKTRQQDIIRAQLELTRLEDKLVMLEQQFESAKKRMSQWLPMSMLTQPVSAKRNDISPLVDFAALKFEQLMPLLIAHPAIVAIEQSVAAKQTEIAVAKQSYKPQFGVNMGYGYRDDTPMGDSRADLFSVGISIDLPLFTDNRQDQQVNAAIAMAESAKTEKLIALQKLKGMYFKEFSQLSRLQQRDALYQTKLLPQMAEQAQATLNAYTRDDGDFSEVMRARISELNAKIDALNIEIDQQIIIARLNYYASSKDAAVMAELVSGEHNEH
ncbi:TolC family protein [Pseudoalteromonas prydzensis]|uniref:TolC family protein n=1 Tax=Pseudoalteromonas prydzensis TaxID=182141 RepID=UPI0024BCA8CE|nr:TolC family protein [Pseudoalteromonas prydzensis]